MVGEVGDSAVTDTTRRGYGWGRRGWGRRSQRRRSQRRRSQRQPTARPPGLGFRVVRAGPVSRAAQGEPLAATAPRPRIGRRPDRVGHAAGARRHCHHLGAHVGHGGTVVGETIRCPFHGFRYDAGGRCVATEYGRAAPRSAVMGTWPVREVGGVIVAWAGAPVAEPPWEIPALDMRGWSPWKVTRYAVCGHPQETTENSVDLGHFSVVHGSRDVAQTKPLDTDGPHLTIAYRMTRQRRRAGIEWPAVSTAYDIDVWGLGWSRVEVEVQRLRLQIGSSSWPPRSRTRRGGAPPRRVHALAARCAGGWPEPVSDPRRPLRGVGRAAAQPRLRQRRRQDFSIWQHKRYLARPALAAGDGPIAPYRRWAQQFYFSPGSTPGAAGEPEAQLSGGSAGSPW